MITKLTKLTVGFHIPISQNRCARFYSGKPVFSANSVPFTPLYFLTSLSWQFLNRTKGNWRSKTEEFFINLSLCPFFTICSRENKNSTWSQQGEVEGKGKRSVGKRKYTIIIRIYNNYINIKTKRNYDYKNRKKRNRTQNILFLAW